MRLVFWVCIGLLVSASLTTHLVENAATQSIADILEGFGVAAPAPSAFSQFVIDFATAVQSLITGIADLLPLETLQDALQAASGWMEDIAAEPDAAMVVGLGLVCLVLLRRHARA